MPLTQFTITFKQGTETVAVVYGNGVDTDRFSIKDISKVPAIEQLLERLTGLRVHIQMSPIMEESNGA